MGQAPSRGRGSELDARATLGHGMESITKEAGKAKERMPVHPRECLR